MTLTPARTEKPPQVPGLPVIGTVAKLMKDPVSFMKRMDQIGPVARVSFGLREMYFVNHPDLVNEVLVARPEEFPKGGTFRERLGPLGGEGLPHIEGHTWSRARKMMRPGFTQRALAAMSEKMVECIEDHLRSWAPKAESGETIDLASEFEMLTMSVLTSTIFGHSLSLNERRKLAYDFKDFERWINWRLWTPGLPERVALPGKRTGEAAYARIDSLLVRLIGERKGQPEAYDDLLSMLVNAKSEDDGSTFSYEQIHDHALNLLFAGHETTAITSTWALALLQQHPTWDERVMREVDEVLGGRKPTFSDWQRLPTVKASWEEAMRMYPPAFINGRTAQSDCQLGGYHVPAGTMVMLNVVGTHYHPDFWDHPDQFDPDRFLGDKAKSRHMCAYYPFGMGQRMCIGRHMATVEAILAIAMIYQRYRLVLDAGAGIKPQVKMSIRFEDGPRMRIEPRASSTPVD